MPVLRSSAFGKVRCPSRWHESAVRTGFRWQRNYVLRNISYHIKSATRIEYFVSPEKPRFRWFSRKWTATPEGEKGHWFFQLKAKNSRRQKSVQKIPIFFNIMRMLYPAWLSIAFICRLRCFQIVAPQQSVVLDVNDHRLDRLFSLEQMLQRSKIYNKFLQL